MYAYDRPSAHVDSLESVYLFFQAAAVVFNAQYAAHVSAHTIRLSRRRCRQYVLLRLRDFSHLHFRLQHSQR